MTARKLQAIRNEQETDEKPVVVPENITLEEIHKYTIEQLVGRPIAPDNRRIIFDFPDAKIDLKPSRFVFKRMMELVKKSMDNK